MLNFTKNSDAVKLFAKQLFVRYVSYLGHCCAGLRHCFALEMAHRFPWPARELSGGVTRYDLIYGLR